MNRIQLLNDQEEAMRLMLEGNQVGLWTALPGIVQSINFEQMTCEVQPAIKAVIEDQFGELSEVNLPLLINVPIVFPSGGGFTDTFPLAVDDEVLVIFASRCIDAWWQSGGVQQAMEARMHDLSDGFAIPGPKSLPNIISSISTSKRVIRNNAGTVYLSIGSRFSMRNAATDLKTVLELLTSALSTFATGLNPTTLSTQASALAGTISGTIVPAIEALLE